MEWKKPLRRPGPPVPPQAVAVAAAAPDVMASTAPAQKSGFWHRQMRWLEQCKGILREDVVTEQVIADERSTVERHRDLQKLVNRQSLVILGLLVVIVFLMPVMKPIYKYGALTPEKNAKPLVALTAPNLTDQAVLSWAATAITEIMTFGFGDFDQRLIAQKTRFTSDGWISFVKALRDQNMRENFKLRQLVLTTVPSNAPVIVAKGESEEEGEDFIWIVEMPVIMTYTTNNNVTSRKKSIARLTIVRVPGTQNISGIGIKKWILL